MHFSGVLVATLSLLPATVFGSPLPVTDSSSLVPYPGQHCYRVLPATGHCSLRLWRLKCPPRLVCPNINLTNSSSASTVQQGQEKTNQSAPNTTSLTNSFSAISKPRYGPPFPLGPNNSIKCIPTRCPNVTEPCPILAGNISEPCVLYDPTPLYSPENKIYIAPYQPYRRWSIAHWWPLPHWRRELVTPDVSDLNWTSFSSPSEDTDVQDDEHVVVDERDLETDFSGDHLDSPSVFGVPGVTEPVHKYCRIAIWSNCLDQQLGFGRQGVEEYCAKFAGCGAKSVQSKPDQCRPGSWAACWVKELTAGREGIEEYCSNVSGCHFHKPPSANQTTNQTTEA